MSHSSVPRAAISTLIIAAAFIVTLGILVITTGNSKIISGAFGGAQPAITAAANPDGFGWGINQTR
jgi:hypothetical protein